MKYSILAAMALLGVDGGEIKNMIRNRSMVKLDDLHRGRPIVGHAECHSSV